MKPADRTTGKPNTTTQTPKTPQTGGQTQGTTIKKPQDSWSGGTTPTGKPGMGQAGNFPKDKDKR